MNNMILASPSQLAPARVIIADDHDLARAGLRSIIESDRSLRVVGEANDGMEAVALCQALKPELALLDIYMPNMDGLAATRMIQQVSPSTRVVIITGQDDPEYISRAFKAGAIGYLLKGATRRELLSTIGQALHQEHASVATPPALTSHVPQHARAGTFEPERLTPRERDVLRLVIEGLTNRQIAGRLSLSVGTVKIHVEHIIAKLGVADRTQAAVHAVERKLLQ